MKCTHYFAAGLFLILALLGVYTIIISDSAFRFDGTFTLGNLVQAAATIGVGLVVASHIQKQTAVERKEKELLLRQLDLITAVLDEVEGLRVGGKLQDVTAALKRLSMTCAATSKLLSALNYSSEITAELSFDDEIKKLRKLATETPAIEDHAKTLKKGSVVRDSIIEIAEGNTLLIENQVNDMKMRILKAQIHINRS